MSPGLEFDEETKSPCFIQQVDVVLARRFVVQVEQWLMDGAYSKVSDIARDVPDPGFKWFMSMLVSTMRSEVASCIEKAYASLSVRDAKARNSQQ